MTNIQLYMAIGLPIFAIVMSMIAGMLQMTALGAGITSLESSMNAGLTSFESNTKARFTSIENRLASLDSRFEMLVGKVIEIDNRLTRVEAILDRQ